jgi:hypothetical protein
MIEIEAIPYQIIHLNARRKGKNKIPVGTEALAPL